MEETILLHFDIDGQPAVNSIKDLRQANSQLRAERDKVNISTKEGRELVDKLNVSIDKNNKVIKDNSSALEKQRQNVGNYSKSIQEAAGNLNIMGTNVGALGSKLTSFINPLTATVGVVTALGAAYASSTIGARDLTFASNQLASATGILTNSFASMFSSAEDGEGAVTKLFNSILKSFGPAGQALAAVSKASALAVEELEDLRRNELIAQTEINERLKENAQIMVDLAESNISYEEKVHLVGVAVGNLVENEEQILAIKNEQLAAIDRQLVADATNEKLLDERALKELEISGIKKDTERAIGRIQKQESNLLDTYNKQNQALDEQNTKRKLAGVKQPGLSNPSIDPTGTLTQTGTTALPIASINNFNEQLQNAQREQLQKTADIEAEIYNQRLGAASLYFSAAAQLAQTAFGEGSALFQALAVGETIINTYSAATAALAPPPLGAGPILGPALAAVTIAAGLANVARIQGVGFADGGYTGRGAKYQPAGIVHKGEYVSPSTVVNSPQAQPHLAALESMRTRGYADGGFVANQNQTEVRQAMMFANALKNMPPVIASWTEGRAIGKKLDFKERVTRQ